MTNVIGLVGVDFEHADIHKRSHLAFSDSQKIDICNVLQELGCIECLVLSTCNRSEIYYAAEREMSGVIRKLICKYSSLDEECFYSPVGDEAILHLFRVSAGLESAVIGEDQILGQVTRALEFAELVGSAGKVLTRLFQTAVSTAKQIKTQTGISSIPVSTAYIAIKKLSEKLGGFENKTVMMIGSGEMSRLVCQYLRDGGIRRILLCSRGCEISQWQEDLACTKIPFSERYMYLTEADAVVCATSSPHTVLSGAFIKYSGRALCIIDMAMPPDVDEDVAAFDNVELINIDQLRDTVEQNLERRRALSESSGALIKAAIMEFKDWLFRSRVDPAIESLNHRCDMIASDMEDYLFRKIELSTRDKKLLDKMLRAGMRRLVREPVLRLKALDDQARQDEYVYMIRELFGTTSEGEK